MLKKPVKNVKIAKNGLFWAIKWSKMVIKNKKKGNIKRNYSFHHLIPFQGVLHADG